MKAVSLALALAAAAAGNVALAADLEAGRKSSDACAACHGKDGKTPIDPTYPKIAGQYSDYMVKAMNDYKDGARKNAIMGAIAKPLSKQDIENLAAYFASLPGPLTHRK